MQFLIIAYDGTDEGAPARRAAIREKHLAVGDAMIAQGRNLFGAAILDDADQMIGSATIADFPSQAELETWLQTEEPYVYGDVWKDIRIVPCRVGPSYQQFLDQRRD